MQVCDLGIPESSTNGGSSEFEEVTDVNMFFSDRGMNSDDDLDETFHTQHSQERSIDDNQNMLPKGVSTIIKNIQ